jgi:hypothetical protein
VTVTVGRRVDSIEAITQGGDYWLNPAGGEGARSLWFLLPGDELTTETALPDDTTYQRPNMVRIAEPIWTFRECPDGSVEVRASILVHGQDGTSERWHGYLDEGHRWRQV